MFDYDTWLATPPKAYQEPYEDEDAIYDQWVEDEILKRARNMELEFIWRLAHQLDKDTFLKCMVC